MTETIPQADAAPDPPHPYNLTALARLLLSDAYRDTAETALNRIGTQDDFTGTVAPGDFVREAAELIRLAEDVQRRAVVYERERGTSWEEIGEALGITRQSAHAKFAEHYKQWREPFIKPERLHPDGTPDDRRIPYGARYAPGRAAPADGSAEKTAVGLDQWLRRHESWADQEHPVSDGLPRFSTHQMRAFVCDAALAVRMDQLVPDPRAEADLWDLHADLGERLIRESEREAELLHPKIDYPREIARDRERATALRAAANRANTHDPAHASADATEDTAR